MASVSVLVSAAHVLVSVLVSKVPALSTESRGPASVSRPASRPKFHGLGLGLGHPCLRLGLGGPGLDYNPALSYGPRPLMGSRVVVEAGTSETYLTETEAIKTRIGVASKTALCSCPGI